MHHLIIPHSILVFPPQMFFLVMYVLSVYTYLRYDLLSVCEFYITWHLLFLPSGGGGGGGGGGGATNILSHAHTWASHTANTFLMG